MTRWITACVAAFFLFAHSHALAGSSEEKKLSQATQVLQDFVNIPENAVPPALLNQAYGIAVIPSVLKVGFIIGGRHGSGVIAVRNENGAWSNPSFLTLTGGSIGWQIGASSTDIILVFKSERSIERIERGDITLGGDASVAAGPVGRSVSASTDIRFEAEVYSYSRARGLFAGISVEGAALSIDKIANADFYDKPGISAETILSRTQSEDLPGEGQHFMMTLDRYLPRPNR